MKRTIHVKPASPQYSVITNITFAQTDAWFGHTTQDLRMDLIYPEDTAHDYPCIVWIYCENLVVINSCCTFRRYYCCDRINCTSL